MCSDHVGASDAGTETLHCCLDQDAAWSTTMSTALLQPHRRTWYQEDHEQQPGHAHGTAWSSDQYGSRHRHTSTAVTAPVVVRSLLLVAASTSARGTI